MLIEIDYFISCIIFELAFCEDLEIIKVNRENHENCNFCYYAENNFLILKDNYLISDNTHFGDGPVVGGFFILHKTTS